MINDKTTKELEHILEHTDSARQLADVLDDAVNVPSYQNFPDYFFSLEQVKQLETSEIIRQSGLNRSYAYQLLNGTRTNPGQDKVLRLCIAAGLSVEETQRALKIAHAPVLYPKIRRDSILIFCINKHLNLMDTNELLFSFQEEVLH